MNSNRNSQEDFLVSRYFSDISGKSHGLSTEEECELSKRIRKGDKQAEKKLILSNLRFVVNVAKNYQNQGVPLSDLISIGNMGLIRAARRFDGRKNFKFISYAVWWIRQAILQAISDQSRITKLPLNRTARLHRLGKAASKLEQKVGRAPSIEELAEALETDVETVIADMHTNVVSVSMDKSVDGSSRTISEVMADENAECPDTIIDTEMIRKAINRALSILPWREQKVVKLYHGFEDGHEYTLEEIGSEMNLTRERVRQLKDRAIQVLRSSHQAKVLRESVTF